MFPWKRREVLVTSYAEQYGIALRALNSAGIKYDTRIVNSGSSNRKIGNFMGSVVERIDLETFYYIYVRKEDKKRAIYLMEKAK